MNVTEPGFAGGDRMDIGLPARQQALLEASRAGRSVERQITHPTGW